MVPLGPPARGPSPLSAAPVLMNCSSRGRLADSCYAQRVPNRAPGSGHPCHRGGDGTAGSARPPRSSAGARGFRVDLRVNRPNWLNPGGERTADGFACRPCLGVRKTCASGANELRPTSPGHGHRPVQVDHVSRRGSSPGCRPDPSSPRRAGASHVAVRPPTSTEHSAACEATQFRANNPNESGDRCAGANRKAVTGY
jgi:hypothetical protein